MYLFYKQGINIMNPNWYFLKSGAGIVSADNLANPFKDTQLNDYEILVRETFQNYLDFLEGLLSHYKQD